jgi:hypothetical protein
MAQKEPCDAEPDSLPARPDPGAVQREQFASWVQGAQRNARVGTRATPSAPSSRPVAPASSAPAASDPFASLREELPADELTAVFAPSAELLARSGAPTQAGSAWEEPTQVVHVDDVLGALSSAPSSAPPSNSATRLRASDRGPTLEQLDFERRLVALATPVPAPPRRTHWLWWAVAAVLAGAVTAGLAEYSLHPTRARSPGHSGSGLGVDSR